MSKNENNTMETSLREQALDTQQSVGTIAKLVDAVHRHTIAATTCQLALTTEVNELKQKHQEYKAMEKAQKKGRTNMLGELAKGVTNGLFNKNLKEDPSLKSPSATTTVENDEPPLSYKPAIEANVTKAELETA